MSWEELKIKETKISFIDGDRSDNYPSRNEFVDNGEMFLNAESIKNGKINESLVNRITKEKFNSIKKGRIQYGDLLLTTRGNGIGDCAYVNTNKKGLINAQMLILRTDKEKNIFNKYFYYYFKTKFIKEQISNFSSGPAQPQIPIRDLKHIPLILPPLLIQKKIAAVLSAYDDLIENNNRRITILEKMAEEIYREWFVRMRFPRHEKVKFHKGVPEGWEIKMLRDVAEIVDCLHTKKPSQIDNGEGWLLQLENIKENGRFNKRYNYMISKADYEQWTKNIEVKEGDCLITNVGSIAAVAQILNGVKAALGRNMTAVRPRDIPVSFLIQFLLSPHMREEALKKQDLGAIMGTLNVRAINRLAITIPPKDLLYKFDMILTPIRKNIWKIIDANELLITSRNFLLPRLISGKLSVEDLDIKFPQSMEEDLGESAKNAEEK